ncbi:MAG: phosphatase PAP2 family protein [candidate division KSB1 bacterium]|nr:phosphatase PAP2 family protein [candidate division KSB1 bacterium]
MRASLRGGAGHSATEREGSLGYEMPRGWWLCQCLGVVALIALVAAPAWGQDRKEENWRREAALLVGGALAAGSGLYLRSSIPGVGVNPKDPGELCSLDRFFVRGYSARWDVASDVGLVVELAFSLWASISGTLGRRLPTALEHAETALWVTGLAAWSKWATQRPRPYAYHPRCPARLLGDGDSRASFFSEHAAQAFAAAELLRQTSGLPLGAAAQVLAYSLALGVAACRVAAGTHFPTDVAVGAGVGILSARTISALHRRTSRFNLFPTDHGLFLRIRI